MLNAWAASCGTAQSFGLGVKHVPTCCLCRLGEFFSGPSFGRNRQVEIVSAIEGERPGLGRNSQGKAPSYRPQASGSLLQELRGKVPTLETRNNTTTIVRSPS